ncbi:MAG TPA: hypothetical protein DCX06_06700 [Opitutae bacterium]|nr:hypothetical protein [Opitutae bacterium]
MKKTKFFTLLFAAALSPLLLNAQQAPSAVPEEGEAAPKSTRPKQTDKASNQLINNYLAVTGSKQAHSNLRNVVATGTIEEAGRIRKFKLVETQDGKRKVTYTWRHLGREHEVQYAFDGLQSWSQEVKPKEKSSQSYGGQTGKHFQTQRWLLHPFVLPLSASYVFKYQGLDKVYGRPTYVIVGYGKHDERSWFYFDQEKFLITRWGGIGLIAGVEEYMDYSAIRFAKVNGVLLPKEIDLLAEGQPFGTISIDSIEANQVIDSTIFKRPASNIPVLRQRPVQ